jgi:hypothetical protein
LQQIDTNCRTFADTLVAGMPPPSNVPFGGEN